MKSLRKDFRARSHNFNKTLSLLLLTSIRFNRKIFFYKSYKRVSSKFYYLQIKPIKNHCFITGNSRSIVSRYRLVRHEFKRLANSGFIFGFRKATF